LLNQDKKDLILELLEAQEEQEGQEIADMMVEPEEMVVQQRQIQELEVEELEDLLEWEVLGEIRLLLLMEEVVGAEMEEDQQVVPHQVLMEQMEGIIKEEPLQTIV
jgi:hypothetical protein